MTMKISRKGGQVFLAGVIDENADFSELLKEQAPLSIDFSRVERINSIGIRSWMMFMTRWGDKPLNYLECPVIIADQLAVTPALRGIKKRAAVIMSAYMTFDCPNCGHQEDFRVAYDQVQPQLMPGAGNPKCSACGSPMGLTHEDQFSIFDRHT